MNNNSPNKIFLKKIVIKKSLNCGKFVGPSCISTEFFLTPIVLHQNTFIVASAEAFSPETFKFVDIKDKNLTNIFLNIPVS